MLLMQVYSRLFWTTYDAAVVLFSMYAVYNTVRHRLRPVSRCSCHIMRQDVGFTNATERESFRPPTDNTFYYKIEGTYGE